MLKFVTGTAGTGKSEYILGEIVSLARQGKKCILIVPEQFSKTGESLLFTKLSDENVNRDSVQLHSFTSLKTEIENTHGRFAPDTLSQAGRAVMARRAMKNIKGLDVYRKHTDSAHFAYTLAGTFEDLKRSGFSPEQFAEAIQKSGANRPKLNEISLLYREYNGLMGEKFCDEEDIYRRIAENIPTEYVDGQNIFLDGFEHFSHGQLQIIRRWLENSDSVTVALVCDDIADYTKGTGVFSYVQQTAAKLQSMANECGCKIMKPVTLTESHRFTNDDLKCVERYLRDDSNEGDSISENGNVYVNEYPSQAREVQRTVAQIRKLISDKDNPVKYSDIALVCPQLEKYEHQLQESLNLAGMPYFIDEGRIISSSAPVVLFGCIIRIMSEGINADTIMPLLHTQLTDTDAEDVSLMENYLFLWQDADMDFSQPFTLPLTWEGKVSENVSDEDKQTLARINAVREKMYNALSGIANIGNKTGDDILKAVYDTAVKLGADVKMSRIKDSMYSDEDKVLIVRQWEEAVNCLDTLYKILREDVIDGATLYDLYSLMIAGTGLEFSPETQDCIMISEPKRMKLDAVKAVFILGVAQDVFPAVVSSQGLITDSDREALGLKLDSDFRQQSAFEALYFYKALTTAGEKLFISVAGKNIDDKQILSGLVSDMKESLKIPALSLVLTDYALSLDFLADYIANIPDLEEKKKGRVLLKKLGYDVRTTQGKNYDIHDTDTLRKMLERGKTGRMWISPSNAEEYYTCPFMFYLNKVLKIRPLEKARFNRAISGNYLHRIVEIVIKKYGEEFYKQTEKQIDEDIEEAVKQFSEETYPPEIRDNIKFNSQYKNLLENAKEFLHHILAEQQQGLFRPVAFEQKINVPARGENPDDYLKPVRIETENGNKIMIYGTIDRVDIYRGKNQDYLRIVDYKTGNKTFDEKDIAGGLSSQLLVYMNALMNNDYGRNDKPVVPGAVLYQKSEITPVKDDEDKKLYAAFGMALEDAEVSKAFGNRTRDNFGVISGTDKIKKGEGSIVVSEDKFDSVLNYVTEKIKEMGDNAFDGYFEAVPFASRTGEAGKGCSYCRYKTICQRATMTENTNIPPDKAVIYMKGDNQDE